MDPLPKRRKTEKNGIEAEEDEDELLLEPEELNQRRDPAFQLQKGRALAVNKLKSRFEDIFAKYEKDFTGIGDEIDLRTGEVVIDNGHLKSMTIPEDSDDGGQDNNDEHENEHALEEEARILQGRANTESSADASLMTVHRDLWQVAGPSWPPLGAANTPRLCTTMFPEQQPFMSPFNSTPPFGMSTPRILDPAWEAPELPISSLADYSSNAPLGQKRRSTTRRVVRKSLPVPEGSEAEEEDVLLGVSGNVRKTNESPLIKERFPVISSPQDDPNLTEFIQEVIQESLPGSSPSTRISKTPRPQGRGPKRIQDQLDSTGHGSEKKRTLERRKRSKNKTSADQTREPRLVDNTATSNLGSKRINDLENDESHTGNAKASPLEATSSQKPKPLNQVLYIEIRAAKIDNTFLPVRDEAESPKVADEKEAKAKSRESTVQTKFQRNAMDPSFNFSDDDTLLPKRTRRRRQTEPITDAAAAAIPIDNSSDAISKPSSEQPLERNEVDPTFAFSDEENMPPRRSKRKTRLSESAITNITAASSKAALDDASQHVEADHPTSPTRPEENKQVDAQESHPSPAEDIVPAADETDNHIEDQVQPDPAQPEEPATLSPTKQHQQEEPATPSRPKATSKKPHKPTNTSLISLLSDDEDEEDEISLGLTGFTPSGHHRILVHRPFPAGFTNPSFSSYTTTTSAKTTKLLNKKKKRTSLLPSGTPDHDKIPSNTRRKSHHLARSVVKVNYHRRGNRLPSPTGSIVQTPGGTKRRCGEGDFRCERDFCFVCM